MRTTEKAQEALNRLLDMFKSGNFPAVVSRTVIRGDRPCDRWSLCNRLFMFLAGTEDARGFRQWQEVGRKVKKGAKAFYILAPITKKKVTRKVEVDPETGEEKVTEIVRTVTVGFKDIPVFRVEDTEGDPLPDYAPPEPPPLWDVAKRFVEDIAYRPFIGGWYGRFMPGTRTITLATHDAPVFFHELAHAVHHTIKPGGLEGGQHADQEVVAELAACALCELYGYQGYVWHGWQYIRHYAGQDDRKALKAVMGVLAEVERVLGVILGAAEEDKRKAA